MIIALIVKKGFTCQVELAGVVLQNIVQIVQLLSVLHAMDILITFIMGLAYLVERDVKLVTIMKLPVKNVLGVLLDILYHGIMVLVHQHVFINLQFATQINIAL